MRTRLSYLLFFLIVTVSLSAQKSDSTHQDKKSHWYDRISLRGYTQIRYNRLLETNPDLKCESCDRSWGDNGGFFIRRMRLIFSGEIGEHLFIYIQPDFASSASSTGLHFGQLRDAYFDVSIDKKKEFRFRVGQSKVPYGFENMQSSQNRLPLDRNDALNSAVPNERDLGVNFYYAPAKVRELYKDLISKGLKGSGDYGVFGLGIFNGQIANKPELNNNLHVVGRLTYPFKIGSQIIEPGIQAYTGKYTLAKDQLSSGVKVNEDMTYADQRLAGSICLYPKPFGI
ncbi:MAG: porin, partial [Cellulosilyticaceae bacterium]